MTELITLARSGAVAEVALNRAEKRNAISLDMFHQLVEIGESLRSDNSVRAIVLRGEGGHFCAGLDLNDAQRMLAEPGTLKPEWFAGGYAGPANLFQAAAYVFRRQHVPVIAALDGVVYGAGMQIAMGADIRIAAANVRCCVAEIRLGLIPDMGITQTFHGLVRPDVLKRLTFTGEEIAGEAALAHGLVTELTDDPHVHARELAKSIAQRSPDAIVASKALLNHAPQMSEKTALQFEAQLQRKLMGSKNQIKAVQAMVTGRGADFADAEVDALLDGIVNE